MKILMPAYCYPTIGTFWADLEAASSSVELAVIVNPNSGPGASVDPNYVAAVNGIHAAGGRVYGYVATNYGARNQTTVKGEVDRYEDFYSIDGIFFDEMSTSTSKVSYYADLYGYVKGKSLDYEVIGNPGTGTLEAYLSSPTADVLVTFEDTARAYASYLPDAWTASYDADRLAHIIHTAEGSELSSLLDAVAQNNASWVYVTDDVMGNPYDVLPTYWDQEVAAVAAHNVPEPGMHTLALVATVIVIGSCWRVGVRPLSGRRA